MERQYKNTGIEWIGSIPREWKICRLKDIGYLYGGLAGKSGSDFDVEEGDEYALFIPFTNIFNNDVINPSLLQKVKVDINEVQNEVKEGDLLFLMSSEDYDGIGKSSILQNSISKLYLNSFCKGMRITNPMVLPKYLFYLMSSHFVREQLRLEAKGFIRINLRQDKLLCCSLFLPPIGEQQRIVEYLETKCGEIDELIALQEQMIAQLTDFKQSVIIEAVTKGLNPDVQLIPSDINWIGNVPKGWKVAKAKYFVEINNGSDPKEEGNIPVYGSGASSFKTCGEYKEGPTVLIGRKGATLHIPHYIDGKYWNVDTAFDVKIKKEMVLRYYYYLAICFDYKYYISQTTLPGMAQSSYYNMQIPVPPLTEQRAISEHLDMKCGEIDKLIEMKRQKIGTLKEYKKSVIYEAVIGKTRFAG